LISIVGHKREPRSDVIVRNKKPQNIPEKKGAIILNTRINSQKSIQTQNIT